MKITGKKGFDVDDSVLSLGSEGAQVSDYAFNRKWFNIFWLFMSIVIILLSIKVFYISVINHTKYANIASGNTMHSTPIIAPRGRIFASGGEVLVDNKPNYSAIILANYVSDDYSLSTNQIAKLLNLEEDEVKQKISLALEKKTNVVLKEKVTHDEVVNFKTAKNTPKYVQIEKNALRVYNDAELFAHIMGYEGLIKQEEYKEKKDKGYLLTDRIGKTGLEYQYEDYLHGTHGYKRSLRDSRGRVIKRLEEQKVVPGDDIYTNIDFELQKHLKEALEKEFKRAKTNKAVAIAINPNSGAVLAMVSLPSYDNNLFSGGISSEDYKKLIKNPDKPLFNRVISGVYPPGSTVKPVLAALALENNIITPEREIESKGGLQYGKFFFGDWKAHGYTDMRRAIAVSSDVYFYTIGGGYGDIKGLGIEKMHDGYAKFGYGKPTGIDLPNEVSGTNPNKEWKEKNIGEKWYIGDTYHSSIGQGFMSATPMEVINSIIPIANGGTIYKPQIVKKIISQDGKEKMFEPQVVEQNVLSDYALQVAKEGMRETVTDGTARMFKELNVKVAGKTGTAEFGKGDKVHSWFVSFAPYKNPQMLLLVLMEGQTKEISTASEPVAKSVYKWYFDNNKLDDNSQKDKDDKKDN